MASTMELVVDNPIRWLALTGLRRELFDPFDHPADADREILG